MNRSTKNALLLLFVWLPTWAVAESQSDLIPELMERSGLNEQIELLPEAMAQGLAQGGVGSEIELTPEDVAKLQRAVRRSYSPGVMKAVVTAHLRKHLDTSDAESVLGWFNSPLGRKITALEIESSKPEAQAELEKFAANFAQHNIPKEKVALIRKLESALNAIDSATDIALNMAKVGAAAALAASSRDDLSSLPHVMSQVEKARPAIRDQLKQLILVSMLHTYHTLTLEEINQYLEYAQTESGSAFNRVGLEGLKKAFNDAGFYFGKSLAEVLDKRLSRKQL